MSTITALPTPPSREDPANFASRANDLLSALPPMVTEINAALSDIDQAVIDANADAAAASASASAASVSASAATTNGAAQVTLAAAQVTLATTQATNAAASAATALNAPGTSATSTTSLTIGTGAKTLTIQTGKSIAVGASVIIAYTSTPTTRMSGVVTEYSSVTGSLTVNIDTINGSGAYTAWTVSLGSATVIVDVARTWTTEQTFKEVKDTVYTITDGAAFEIDPANGSIQVVTLGASRTPAATNFESGQAVLLGIDDGSAYSITWTTVAPTWLKVGGTGAAPALATSGYTWVLLFKRGSTIFGVPVGSP